MLDTSRTAKWYLVQCKPRQEIRAEENLRNQFFSCYCPLHTVEKIRQGKRVVTQQPLFPGYLFINLCRLSDSWHSIRSTRGVLRLITFANEPLPVPDVIIDDLQARLSKAGNKPLFETGSPVTLIEGPFKDLNAVFCKADGEERAIVLLDLLNRQQQLSVPLRALSASG
ncbi:MAG TPA: transcription/translation regulatory transformer protein RfaH [Marinobacter sp.]|nr:transcription/translation regulatory transformer protein RfaH [Marinobacter sp.]